MGVYSQTTEEGNSTERRVSSNEGTRSHGSNHSSFPTDESNGNSDNGSPDHPEYDAAHTSILAPPHQQSRYAPSRENSPGSPGMAGARSMAPEGGRSPYAACWGQQAACWGQQDAWPRGSESWCGSAGDCQGGGVAAGNAKCLTDAFGLPRGY
ncbi:hypothetical protein T484DRAFT_1769938 [Baffinella frigidus]|nr:hypothetical protein T484DRAFT_1769938 [Cryptophyta sp. CCMP2293]|mmetsp:Transcript_32677/g.77472  ORF Transcript_32677/g.77472 Transcript_32677/m.77472 type:complete len:153 (+) Transcript_32677:1525-1983(+)